MINFFEKKKIVIIYFLYLALYSIYSLHHHLEQFPFKYVYTDWLINYEGGFVRRGFLGQIIYKISLISKINFENILLFFQIAGYLIYFGLILNFLLKIKINFFWILLIFSTISFLYPFAELEATGRKDIYVILLFSIFAFINYKTLNECIITFIILFTISCLIHEITFFYLPYFLIILFYTSKLKLKESLKLNHFFLIFIILCFLIYLNLIIGDNVNIDQIVASYKFMNINISSNTGAFSWLVKPFSYHFSVIASKISLTSILRYGYIFLVNVIVLIYFIRLKHNLNFLSFEMTTKKIFCVLVILSLPIYFIALDWGRITYINFNFMMLLVIYFKKENLIDEIFLEEKIEKLTTKLKFLIFIFICFLFSPKILIDEDLSSFPLYKTFSKLSGSISINLF
ncbi:hypothetical protein N9U47_02680 [Candidatus Pelagibacter sp.]|nr:hypothetical protein [Candidatus Pelagibacter sp.]